MSFLDILFAKFSAVSADKTTWSLFIMITDCIFLPHDASIKFPLSLARRIRRFIGAESVPKTETTLSSDTKFPNPTLKSFNKNTSLKVQLKFCLTTHENWCIIRQNKKSINKDLEAPPRFELGIEVLQTSALPLGYSAIKNWSG